MKHANLIRAIVMAALLLAAAGTANAGRVVISTFIDPVPVSIISERVMAEAYRRIGLTMEIRRFPGERAIQTANSGQVDGELFRKEGIEQTYPNLIRIPVVIALRTLWSSRKARPSGSKAGKACCRTKWATSVGSRRLNLMLCQGPRRCR